MQNQKSSIDESTLRMSKSHPKWKWTSGSNAEPLEADQYLRKDNSLLDPFEHTINQEDKTTSQKQASSLGQMEQKEREGQPQNCKKCSYNFNEESECRNLPFEMFPLSEDHSASEKQDEDYGDATDPDRRSRRTTKKNGDNADIQLQNVLQQGQNIPKRKTPKTDMLVRHKNGTKIISCKCKKTHCIKSHCECFLSNLGCNANCECLDCANWSETPKAKKKLHSPTTPRKEGRTGHSCQCKKTSCIKNYCECYQSGLKCGEGCHCMDCQNRGV